MPEGCCAGKSTTHFLIIGNQEVGISNLEAILAKALEHEDATDTELKQILLRELNAHNYVPPPAEEQYQKALWQRFKEYRALKKGWIEDKYHGIPREEIPWFPKVDDELCTGCNVCVDMCHRGVYKSDEKARVVNPFRCIVSCTGCAQMCPEGAISFPTLVQLRKDLRELRKKYGLRE